MNIDILFLNKYTKIKRVVNICAAITTQKVTYNVINITKEVST